MMGQLNSNFRVVKGTVSLSALLSRVRLYNCVPNLVTPLVLKELVHQISTRFVLSNVYFFSILHVTQTRYPCFCQQKSSLWCKRCHLSSYDRLLTAPALCIKITDQTSAFLDYQPECRWCKNPICIIGIALFFAKRRHQSNFSLFYLVM